VWGLGVAGLGGLSDSFTQLTVISKAWPTVQMAAAKWYIDYLSSTKAMLIYMSVFNHLLQSQQYYVTKTGLTLSFPSLQHQRQILQELYKRKLNSATQFSLVLVESQVLQYFVDFIILQREKNIKTTIQHVPNKTTIFWCGGGGGRSWGPLRLSQTAHCHIQSFTAKWYTDYLSQSTKAMLTYTSIFNHLLRSPNRTQVLQFN
jgi:hypothetical protein